MLEGVRGLEWVYVQTRPRLSGAQLWYADFFSRKTRQIRKIDKKCYCRILCLKYNRASRYRMRYVIINLFERRCTGCKNKWSSLLENNVDLQRLNGIIILRNICVRDAPCWNPKLRERVNASSINCYCRPYQNRTMKCLYKRDVTLKSERVPEYHKLQGRPRN